MQSNNIEIRFEPGYGYFERVSTSRGFFARKLLCSQSLEDFSILLNRLKKRQTICFEHLVNLIDIAPISQKSTIIATFEYFPVLLSSKIQILRKSVYEFVSFASQLLCVWKFLWENDLFLPNFEFNVVRFDHINNKYKVIDCIETLNFNDKLTVHMEDVESFISSLYSSRCGVMLNKRKLSFALSLGLIFMAIILSEEDWAKVKQAIVQKDAVQYKYWQCIFYNRAEIKNIISLIGKKLFRSTVSVNAANICTPAAILERIYTNVCHITKQFTIEVPIYVKKQSGESCGIGYHQGLPSNDTFTMISCRQSLPANEKNQKITSNENLDVIVSNMISSENDIYTQYEKGKFKKQPDMNRNSNVTSEKEVSLYSKNVKIMAHISEQANTSSPRNSTNPPVAQFALQDKAWVSPRSSLEAPNNSFSGISEQPFDNIRQIKTINFDKNSMDDILYTFSDSKIRGISFRDPSNRHLDESIQIKTQLFNF